MHARVPFSNNDLPAKVELVKDICGLVSKELTRRFIIKLWSDIYGSFPTARPILRDKLGFELIEPAFGHRTIRKDQA